MANYKTDNKKKQLKLKNTCLRQETRVNVRRRITVGFGITFNGWKSGVSVLNESLSCLMVTPVKYHFKVM